MLSIDEIECTQGFFSPHLPPSPPSFSKFSYTIEYNLNSIFFYEAHEHIE